MNVLATITAALFTTALAFAQSQSSINDAWKGFSDPDIMNAGFTHMWSGLPMEGSIQVGPRAWSGDYWSLQKGSINIRWNSPKKEGFNYKSPSQVVAMSMSQVELEALSPTEKYDMFLGRYNYPLKYEVAATASRSAPDWAGICHGWSPASLHHNEPTPKVMVNPEGIKVPFGSSDIKALLSYYYAFYHETETGQMGLRCFFGRFMGGVRGCGEDLNAGAFHIVITNKLGIEKEGLLMDKDRYRQVWNQPVVGFKSKILKEKGRASMGAAKNTVREITVATDLFYIDESENNTWEPVMGTSEQKVSKMELEYRLELNAEGKIIGGEWESDARPDFIWNKARVSKFEGQFSKLADLLND